MDIEATFKALADPTRLRIVRLLGAMELAVGELAQVLGQSQPRVSRHVGILCDAGLAERRREGSWVFMRAPAMDSQTPQTYRLLMKMLQSAEKQDGGLASQCEADRQKLALIRSARGQAAEEYFARHADDWDELRRKHSPDNLIEQGLQDALSERAIGQILDVGTGTGRIAELFAPQADRHFAPDPQQALHEAARVTRLGGCIAIVDFAAHGREELRERHAHTWLGFASEQMAEMLRDAGYDQQREMAFEGEELVVKIWLGERTDTKVRALSLSHMGPVAPLASGPMSKSCGSIMTSAFLRRRISPASMRHARKWTRLRATIGKAAFAISLPCAAMRPMAELIRRTLAAMPMRSS